MPRNSDSLILQLYARTPAPCRDYCGLTVTKDEVVLNIWNITYGPHVYPKRQRRSLEDFTGDKFLQSEIQRLFGQHVVEYVTSIARHEKNFRNLPEKAFLNILKYLAVKDILNLSQTSKIAFELCNTENSWAILFRKYFKTRPTCEDAIVAERHGWKNALLQKIGILKGPKIRRKAKVPIKTTKTNAKRMQIQNNIKRNDNDNKKGLQKSVLNNNNIIAKKELSDKAKYAVKFADQPEEFPAKIPSETNTTFRGAEKNYHVVGKNTNLIAPKSSNIIVGEKSNPVAPKSTNVIVGKNINSIAPNSSNIIVGENTKSVAPKSANIIVGKNVNSFTPKGPNIIAGENIKLVAPKSPNIVIVGKNINSIVPKSPNISVGENTNSIAPKGTNIFAGKNSNKTVPRNFYTLVPKYSTLMDGKNTNTTAPKSPNVIDEENTTIVPRSNTRKNANPILPKSANTIIGKNTNKVVPKISNIFAEEKPNPIVPRNFPANPNSVSPKSPNSIIGKNTNGIVATNTNIKIRIDSAKSSPTLVPPKMAAFNNLKTNQTQSVANLNTSTKNTLQKTKNSANVNRIKSSNPEIRIDIPKLLEETAVYPSKLKIRSVSSKPRTEAPKNKI